MLRFLDHIQRHTTFGRTPLVEWSARRRDLYLTTYNTHNRQTSMLLVGFEPIISAGKRLQTYALDRAATGVRNLLYYTSVTKEHKLYMWYISIQCWRPIIFEDLERIYFQNFDKTLPKSRPWFDLQLDAQYSYLFINNTFIKLLYVFRALPYSSSGGLSFNCIYAASGIVTLCRWLSCAPVKKELSSFLTGVHDSHMQTVTIPEAACMQLRRRPSEDEKGNARNMQRSLTL